MYADACYIDAVIVSKAGRRLGDPRNENNFGVVVDPYDAPSETRPDVRVKGATLSPPVLLPGLLSAEDAALIVKPGRADPRVQSYNFRLCVTTNASNKIEFVKPDEYHPEDWELARRLYKKWNRNPDAPSCNTGQIPNGKFDMNNCGPIVRSMLISCSASLYMRVGLVSFQACVCVCVCVCACACARVRVRVRVRACVRACAGSIQC